jgi:hypothetical protein
MELIGLFDDSSAVCVDPYGPVFVAIVNQFNLVYRSIALSFKMGILRYSTGYGRFGDSCGFRHRDPS